MKKYVLVALMALTVIAQPVQAGPLKEGWKQLRDHFGKAAGRTEATIEIGKAAGEIGKQRREETTIERLERENKELQERIQREQERETKHTCRQCERSAPDR